MQNPDLTTRDSIPTLIQSLWIGSQLSTMEQLSITSYLKHGHVYHLYTYEDVKGIPAGAIIKDGNDIIPESKIKYFKNYADFSDYFRYNLLLKKGGWWVDTDTICLKSFDFSSEYVFASEHTKNGSLRVNNGYLNASAGSPIMEYGSSYCEQIDVSTIKWGAIGPALLTRIVDTFQLRSYVHAPEVFNPIPWWRWGDFLNPGFTHNFSDTTYAVHLWHEMWRRDGLDMNADFHPDCLYEKLKRQYGISSIEMKT